MRTILTVVAVLLIVFAGYAYVKNPAGCLKIMDDFNALAVSLVNVEINSSAAPETASNVAGASNDASPEIVPTNTAPQLPIPAPPALPANTLIQNGDFSDSDAHWQGNGVTPQGYAAANPSMPKDPLTSKGLIVTLHPAAWTRIYQTFPTDKGTQYSIAVTYRLSPNVTLSKDPADYANIGKSMQVPGFENFGTTAFAPNTFYGTIGDPSSSSVSMEVYSPTLGSSDVQTYHHTYPPVPVSGTKTVALAFPPGTGIVVILTVAVTSN